MNEVDSPLPPPKLLSRISGVGAKTLFHRELARRAPWLKFDDPVAANEEIGRSCAEAIRGVLPDDWRFDGKRVLDFGCGVGRTLRHFPEEARVAELHGCDIDEASVAWLKEHYSPPFTLAVNGETPPLPYPDAHFDLVWAISVFTHLTGTWSRWLIEMRRILKPGGLFVASFAGAGYGVALAAPPWHDRWDEDRIGMNVVQPANSWDDGGPTVFHSRWWLTEHWGRAFDIVEMRPDGLAAVPGMGQGIVLMRKDDRDVTAVDLERPADDPRELAALRHNRDQLAAEIRELTRQVQELTRHAAAVAEERDRSHAWRRDAVERFEDAQAAYGALRAAYDELAGQSRRFPSVSERFLGRIMRRAAERFRRPDEKIAQLERALAETTHALEQARERLQLLPKLHEAQEDAARRLRDATDAYASLSAAHDELLMKHSVASPDAVRPRTGALETVPSPSAVRVRWEYPPEDALVSDYLCLSGWAVSDAEVIEAVLCSRCGRQPLRLGRPRWDVAAIFPEHAHAPRAGFEAVIPVSSLPGGTQTFELVMRDDRGQEFRESRRFRIDPRGAYREWLAAATTGATNTASAGLAVWLCEHGEWDDGARAATLESLAEQTAAAATTIGHEPGDSREAMAQLAQARVPWVVVVRPGARLDPDALASIAGALGAGGALDALYGDHDLLGSDGEREKPFLKPGWSPELLAAMEYIGPVVAVRRELVETVVGQLGRIPPPDQLLRRLLDERGLRVERLARVLASIPPSMENGRNGVRPPASPVSARPVVSVLVASANTHGLLGRCVESLRTRTRYEPIELVLVDTSEHGIDGLDSIVRGIRHRILRWNRPFNYSEVNNFAAEQAAGELLVLLNDDTEVISPDWIERMLEQARLPGVGVVGAKLVRPDGTLQHAGIRLVKRFAAAKHLFDGLPADDPGPRGLLTVPRNCSAVTFACAMTSAGLYEDLGGLDPEMKVTFNDVDFCLRALDAGERVVWTPHAKLLHHEQASRGPVSYPADMRAFRARWGELASDGDPYYHPGLSDIVDYELLLPHERELV